MDNTTARGHKRSATVRAAVLAATFCLLASLAIVRDGRLLGHSFRDGSAGSTPADTVPAGVINTSELGKKIIGYGGIVPVEIFTTGGVIDSVRPLPNHETPRFFRFVTDARLHHAWDGHTLAEAAEMEVDAVTGATFSSRALIANVRAGAADAINAEAQAARGTREVTIKLIAVLAVVLCGAILPLFVKRHAYRMVQQTLNAAVLGFWAGTFLDYAVMLNFFANGPSMTLASIITLLLLIVGLIYPLFGHPGHYCAWICPLGSIQDMAGHLSQHKIHIGPRTTAALTAMRRVLWTVLIIMLYVGWGAGWIDYELFSAFIIKTASWAVITAGAVVVALAVVIPRPYCRFICPTGTLLRGR